MWVLGDIERLLLLLAQGFLKGLAESYLCCRLCKVLPRSVLHQSDVSDHSLSSSTPSLFPFTLASSLIKYFMFKLILMFASKRSQTHRQYYMCSRLFQMLLPLPHFFPLVSL